MGEEPEAAPQHTFDVPGCGIDICANGSRIAVVETDGVTGYSGKAQALSTWDVATEKRLTKQTVRCRGVRGQLCSGVSKPQITPRYASQLLIPVCCRVVRSH